MVFVGWLVGCCLGLGMFDLSFVFCLLLLRWGGMVRLGVWFPFVSVSLSLSHIALSLIALSLLVSPLSFVDS